MRKIQCSVGILTRNSAATLRRALESVHDFDDIVICDGGSTDETLDIAREFDAHVIEQDAEFRDSSGRIIDFSGVRDQMLHAARHDWYLWLDSDEFVGQEIVAELASVIKKGIPAAFWVPRKFVFNGIVIDHAVSYPSQQIRFFHRSVARGFRKPIHERVDLTVVPLRLRNYMFVPIPDSVGALRKKWSHYLSIERARLHRVPFSRRIRASLREAAIGVFYVFRIARIALFTRGTKLPISYEWARVWYQMKLIQTLLF